MKARSLFENYFNYAAGGGHVETIRFADNSTFDLDGQSWTMHGTEGADTLWGAGAMSTGIDTIYGGGGSDIIHANAPNQSDSNANYLYGEGGNDSIYGGSGNDTVDGGAGIDYILSYAGNDDITFGSGDDVVIDSAGNDTYHYALETTR